MLILHLHLDLPILVPIFTILMPLFWIFSWFIFSGDVSVCFHTQNYKLYSHGGNVSFSKYFHQHFLADKWDECLKLEEVQEKWNLIIQKNYISFLRIEIEIEISIKSIFYNLVETLTCTLLQASMLLRARDSDSKTMQVAKEWSCWDLN